MQRDDRTYDERDAPAPDTFKEAVLGEDPSDWGSRRADDVRPAGWGHPSTVDATIDSARTNDVRASDVRATDTRATASTTRTGQVAGDVGAATYVPPRTLERERVVERRRAVAPVVDAEPPVDRPRFSLAATFLGWAVAAFFTIVFSAIALALTGANEAQDGTLDLSNLAIVSLIGYLVASFLAYLIGGYAAGRISLWNGVWHGLGTVVWAVLFAVGAVLAGLYAADLFDIGARLDLADLTGPGLLAIGLSLLAMLAGAALGGRLGERYHERADTVGRRREVRGYRGRAL